MSDLLTIKEVARRWSCSTRNVRRIIGRGELPVIATGDSPKGDRIDPADVDAFEKRKKTIRGNDVCLSTNVVAFGTRAPNSVASELNAVLARKLPKPKPRNSSRRYSKGSTKIGMQSA